MNDHIIGSVDIELDLGTRVRVAKTQLGHVLLLWLQCLHQLRHVDADAATNLLDHLATADLDAALLLDGLEQFRVQNADGLTLGQV